MSAVRTLLVVLWRPVLERALPAFVAVGLLASVVFSPQGLTARDLVRGMDGSPPLRAAVWLVWLVLAAPASRAVFTAPGTVTLRSLLPRRSSPALLAGLAIVLTAVHAPLVVLFARGSGALAAVDAASLAIGIEAAAVASPWWAAAGLVAAIAGVPFVGIVFAPVAVVRAWRRAPEAGTRARVRTWTTSPAAALVTMHLLRLARRDRPRLALAAVIASLGGAGLSTLRTAPTDRPIGRALAVISLPCAIVAAMFAGPVLESERQATVHLRSLRVPRTTVAAAFLLAVASPTTALATTASAAGGFASAGVTASVAGWALALSVIVGAWARRHARTRERSPAVFALGVVLVALAAIVLAMGAPW